MNVDISSYYNNIKCWYSKDKKHQWITAAIISILLIACLLSCFDIFIYKNINNKCEPLIICKSYSKIKGQSVIAKTNEIFDSHIKSKCLAQPGDTISIIDGYFYINGQQIKESANAKASFLLTQNISYKTIHEIEHKCNLKIKDKNTVIKIPLTYRQELWKNDTYSSIQQNFPNKKIFPYNEVFGMNEYNISPIYLPHKNDIIELNYRNAIIYSAIIKKFEVENFTIKNNECYINDKKIETYQFKNDYYWLLNDNRDDIYDSRLYGPIPKKNIIGKIL